MTYLGELRQELEREGYDGLYAPDGTCNCRFVDSYNGLCLCGHGPDEKGCLKGYLYRPDRPRLGYSWAIGPKNGRWPVE